MPWSQLLGRVHLVYRLQGEILGFVTEEPDQKSSSYIGSETGLPLIQSASGFAFDKADSQDISESKAYSAISKGGQESNHDYNTRIAVLSCQHQLPRDITWTYSFQAN
jgi:hypothetical protein